MPIATPHHPDGSPVCHPGAWRHQPGEAGVPLVYDRATEERALISAAKAWWHPKALDPALSLPPVGALIRVDGVDARRWDTIPVLDAAGEIVDVRYDWVDVRAERAAAERAAAVQALKAQRSRS